MKVQSVKHLTAQWFLQSVSNCSRNNPVYEGRVVEKKKKKKKMKCMVMYEYPIYDMHFVQRKGVLISEISVGILYVLSDKMFCKCSSNLVEHNVRLFTTKQDFFFTLLHLRYFRQFQNLSEEIWSRADENSIELCFVVFLGNKSKECFILV